MDDYNFIYYFIMKKVVVKFYNCIKQIIKKVVVKFYLFRIKITSVKNVVTYVYYGNKN